MPILKYLVSLLLLITSIHAIAQDGLFPLNSEKEIYYADSGKPQLTKDQTYKKVQEWVSKTFGNYKNAVSFEDSVAGTLRVTSYVPVIHATYAYVRFDMTVSCADNQYQANIKNLDGVSTIHSPERLSIKNNDAIAAEEVLINAETNRRKKSEMQEKLKSGKADIEGINTAMYNLLASLKNMFI